MITPVLKYWKLTDDPFKDEPLKGSKLDDLFTARRTEIRKIRNNINRPLISVSGKQGIGKTTLLHRYIAEKDFKTYFVRLTGTSTNTIYREILASMLLLFIHRKVKIKSGHGIKLKDELSLIQNEIVSTSRVSLGISKILVLNHSHDKAEKRKGHTEESAQQLIEKLISILDEYLVLIIDDFDRIRFGVGDVQQYMNFLMLTFRTVLDCFQGEYIRFIFSLESYVMDLIEDSNETDLGDLSFGVGRHIFIEKFSPQDLKEMFEKRLTYCGWDKPIEEFMSKEAFQLMYFYARGNPRRAFYIMNDAMQDAEDKKYKSIKSDNILYGVKENRIKLDERTYKVVEYLSEHGPSYAEEVSFQKHTDISAKTLRGFLENMEQSGLIEMEYDIVGKRKTTFYSLLSVNW